MNRYLYIGHGVNRYESPTITPLRQCVNDIKGVSQELSRLGYGVSVYFDNDCASEAILSHWRASIASIKPNEKALIVWHNSSHGTQIPDTTGTEKDGKTECLCAYDTYWDTQVNTFQNVITDDEVFEILDTVPDNITIECVFDSCCSGDMTRGIIPNRKFIFPRDYKTGRITKSISQTFIEKQSRHILLAGTAPDKYSYENSNGGMVSSSIRHLLSKVTSTMPTREEAIAYILKRIAEENYEQPSHFECSQEVMKDGLFRLPFDNLLKTKSKSFLKFLYDILIK